MSYADMERKVQPGSLAAAGAINALVIVGLIVSGPGAVKAIVDNPIIGEWIDEPLPPPPDDPVKEVKQKEDKLTKVTSPPVASDNDRAKSDNGLTAATDDGNFTDPVSAGGGGDDVVIPPPPDPTPPLPNPVIKGARPDPRYAGVMQPEYPPSKIRAEEEGSVTVRVLIGTDGRVRDVVVVSSADETFADATKRHALRKWRFLPATSDGTPIEAWREMTVHFRMP